MSMRFHVHYSEYLMRQRRRTLSALDISRMDRSLSLGYYLISTSKRFGLGEFRYSSRSSVG